MPTRPRGRKELLKNSETPTIRSEMVIRRRRSCEIAEELYIVKESWAVKTAHIGILHLSKRGV